MKIREIFAGRIKFEVDCLNHARLFEKLRGAAAVKNVKSEPKKLTFCCAKKDKTKIIAILNELCYNYTILEEKGMLSSLARVRSRAGVIAGVLISVALMVLYPHFVLTVNVNDSGYETQTKEILEAKGVKLYGFLWSLDCNELETELLALDGVSYAKVTRQGTSVVVQLERELDPPEYLFESGYQVKSKRRATVTRTVIYSGTAVVKYGDVVNAGEVLIDGFILVGEEKVKTHASGEVFGKVYVKKDVYFDKTEWQNTVGRVEQQEKTAQLLTEATLFSGEVVTDKWFSIRETETGWIVSVTLECEVKISA